MHKWLNSGTPHLLWGNFSPLCSPLPAHLLWDPEFQKAVVLISAVSGLWDYVLKNVFESRYGFLFPFTCYLPLLFLGIGRSADCGLRASFSVFCWHCSYACTFVRLFKTLKCWDKLIMAVFLWRDEEGAQIVSGVKTILIFCNVLSFKGDCKNTLIH